VPDNYINFRGSLIGYNKDQVNRYMNKLTQQKKDSIDELKKNISALYTENLMLERELERLKQQLTYSVEQEDFMKFALLKLEEKIVPVFEKLAEEEVISISMLGETQEMSYNTKINDYLNKAKNFSSSGRLQFPTNDTNITAAKPVETIIEDSKNTAKDIYSMELPVDIPNNNETPKPTDFNIYYKDPDSVKQFFTSGFWGDDLEDVLNSTTEDDIIYGTPDIVPEKAIIEDEQTKPETSQELIQEGAHTAECENSSKTELVPEPVIEHKQIENKEMASKIKDVRLKYLVGKIVGEDLMDKTGKLLAKKGSTITELLVEVASIEGMLSELIINMQLPETSQ
jgi:cell division septum initiation protein DivIVA